MSEALDRRREILTIARLLGLDAGELAYLEEVPAADLCRLRDDVTARLFDAGAGAFDRLAASSRLLPTGLVATLSERVFGPVISARIAGRLEPERAVELAAKLPVSFLADIASELDPRRAHDVLAGIPEHLVAAVGRELTARGEWVVMGRFVAHLPEQSLDAAVAHMDGGDLLEIALVLEDKAGTLPDIVERLGPDRLAEMVALAEASGLADEAVDLLPYLTPEQRAIALSAGAGARRSA